MNLEEMAAEANKDPALLNGTKYGVRRGLPGDFYSIERAIEENLSTVDAFREGHAAGVEYERKRAHAAKVKRSFVKPTRLQLLKFRIETWLDRRRVGG